MIWYITASVWVLLGCFTDVKEYLIGAALFVVAAEIDIGFSRLLRKLKQNEKEKNSNGGEAVTSDAEPIVRCVDCKHLYFKDMSGYCPHMVGPCAPDGFCHYGERRDKNA